MQLSPLILKGYIITELSVKAQIPRSSEEARKAIDSATANCATSVQVGKNEDNPRQWKVSLRIAYHPTAKDFSPYSIDAELLGLFEVDKVVEDDKVQNLVLANAPTILYGAARELILLITGRGPMPAVMLPSGTFVDLIQAAKDTEQQDKSAHVKKTAKVQYDLP
jgi:preprotein translocase subunit SecB